nr:hypothetical protein [Tanacetum cinerariifolium]
MCGTKVCEEQKQNMEDMMLELLKDCRQKELYCMHNDVEDLIESALNSKLLWINLKSERLDKEKQEVKNIVEHAPKFRTRLTKCLKNFKVIHNESIIPLNKMPQISPVIANTPDLPTKEPEYSLSMGDDHFSTILKMESDEVIKSGVENLVQILSESKVTFDNEKESDFDLEEEIRVVKNLLYDNSSPRPPKELNAEITDIILESLSPSPILVEDSDSQIEEIDLSLATDDLMPPGIKNDDYDSKGDIHFLEELLSDDPLPLPENESSNFDHHDDPSFPHPPPEPPDVEDTITSIFSENPMMMYGGDIPLSDVPIAPDLEASRARGFVHLPLEFRSFAYGNPIS